MKNKGKHFYRIATDEFNSLEKVFAVEWEKENNSCYTLNRMLSEDSNNNIINLKEASDRDREVAATVIQWLGSNVGQYFLKNVNEVYRSKK